MNCDIRDPKFVGEVFNDEILGFIRDANPFFPAQYERCGDDGCGGDAVADPLVVRFWLGYDCELIIDLNLNDVVDDALDNIRNIDGSGYDEKDLVFVRKLSASLKALSNKLDAEASKVDVTTTVDTKEFADCNEVAELLRIKPNSVRTRLYRTGSLWGIKPMKAPNGRNLFPVAAVRGLIRGSKVV